MVLDVIVEDENDNSPVFERSYFEKVREDAPSNQWIVQVRTGLFCFQGLFAQRGLSLFKSLFGQKMSLLE